MIKHEKSTTFNPATRQRDAKKETVTSEAVELPIKRYEQEIKETVASNEITLVIGETGSGKTTEMPLYLQEALGREAKIAITQPRRVAARSVARFVAQKQGVRVGEEVGYQVRFEDHTTEGTRLNFMTDGILLQKLKADPLLHEYAAVMVDEAHERSVNIDLALGLLKHTQALRQEHGLPPLKLIITSATLEKEKFTRYFNEAPTIEVPGRLHPIDVQYREPRLGETYIEKAAETVKEILEKTTEGDILVFMPGTAEIHETIAQIAAANPPHTHILPLHGQLPPEQQDLIFSPTKERKVIVATNIAETSITVPGIRFVVDSGYIKQLHYDPKTGIESLKTVPHAKSGCIQRSGRAGRVAPGVCYRLYSEQSFNERPEYQTPEIQRSNLAHVVLLMKEVGITDVKKFDLIDPPPTEAVEAAEKELMMIGALDAEGRLTETGKKLVRFPLEPRIASMVLEAAKHECVAPVCTIAAFLGQRSVFVRPKEKEREADAAHQKFRDETSDFLTLLNVWDAYYRNHFSDQWAKENFLHTQTLKEVRAVRAELLKAAKRMRLPTTPHAKEAQKEDVAKAITKGLLDKLLVYRGYYKYGGSFVSTGDVYIHPSSALFHTRPEFMVSAEIVHTSKKFARLNQAVKPEWLVELAPHLLDEQTNSAPFYSAKHDQVVFRTDLYLTGAYREHIDTHYTPAPPEEIPERLAYALLTGDMPSELHDTLEPILEHNHAILKTMEQWHVRTLGRVPKITRDDLKDVYQRFIKQHNIHSLKEFAMLAQANPEAVKLRLEDLLPPEKEAELEMQYPQEITVNGTVLEITYSSFEKHPYTTITPEALFRLSEMPRIPAGDVVHLRVKDPAVWGTLAEGDDLQQLKETVAEYYRKQTYQTWMSEHPEDVKRLEQPVFDPLTQELPSLPEPIAIGEHPLTHEPLFLHPAWVLQSNDDDTYRLELHYLPPQEAAETQEKTIQYLHELKEKEQEKQQREKLLSAFNQAKQELERLTQEIRQFAIPNTDTLLTEARRALQEADVLIHVSGASVEEAAEALQVAVGKMQQLEEQIVHFHENIDRAREAIERHYARCPLCSAPLEGGQCNNPEHKKEQIRFEQPDHVPETVVLSELQTDTGKLIARLSATKPGTENAPIAIVLEPYYHQHHDQSFWHLEPFTSIEFIDHHKIRTSEEIEKLTKPLSKEELADALKALQKKFNKR